jgi:hypothetical protein
VWKAGVPSWDYLGTRVLPAAGALSPLTPYTDAADVIMALTCADSVCAQIRLPYGDE